MVRLVQTLWFETISALNQPFIDTPIGMITIRQALLVGAGAALGYGVYRIIPPWVDAFVRIGAGIVPFALLCATAAKRVKTIPPEQYLLLLLRPRSRPARARPKGEREAATGPTLAASPAPAEAPISTPPPAPPPSQSQPSAPAAATATAPTTAPPPTTTATATATATPATPPSVGTKALGEPLRLRPAEEVPEEVLKTLRTFVQPLKAVSAVIGEDGSVSVTEVLKNPKTGAPMLNTRLYASVGSKIITAASDERGAYTIKFYPRGPGAYYMLVAVQGFGVPVDSILINVSRGY